MNVKRQKYKMQTLSFICLMIPLKKTYGTPANVVQKVLSVDLEIMDIDSDFEELSNPEPIFLKELAEVVELVHFIFRSSGNKIFHGLQRTSWGIVNFLKHT
ncbi:hypothetical protein AYI68_g1276 [Smittium mucronatum]|uniref:Uncharacterized protein n=1 Tax=Smittium mucronatum TaxID=133383 RepID=A0A1R0H646_9FUNG|nr:hypothetical protein AYI68_g1276 [Smittium mucronatum]